jgi:hypothetical protein
MFLAGNGIMTLKSKMLSALFAVMSISLVFIYMLYQRRGRSIVELHSEAQKQLLAQELLSIKEQAARSEDDQKKALERYSELKLRHAGLLKKLGLSLASVSSVGPRNKDN